MMTCILSNLPEVSKNIVENIEDKINDEDDPLTIERIWDKLKANYDCMNIRSETKSSNGEEKALYVLIYKKSITCLR